MDIGRWRLKNYKERKNDNWN